MSVGIGTVLVACLSAALGACDGDDAGGSDAIWPDGFEQDWPEVRDCRLSPAEHDGFHIRVFASPEAQQAYVDGVYPFEPGTMLVKGEYDDEECTQLERVSVMLRLTDGEDPELGDWQWQRTDADGRALEDTPARSCAGCHAACSGRDRACTDP